MHQSILSVDSSAWRAGRGRRKGGGGRGGRRLMPGIVGTSSGGSGGSNSPSDAPRWSCAGASACSLLVGSCANRCSALPLHGGGLGDDGRAGGKAGSSFSRIRSSGRAASCRCHTGGALETQVLRDELVFQGVRPPQRFEQLGTSG